MTGLLLSSFAFWQIWFGFQFLGVEDLIRVVRSFFKLFF